MTQAYLNRIATAVPPYAAHARFLDFAPSLLSDARQQALFARMAKRAQIEERYSVLPPGADPGVLDAEGFYRRHAFPSTAARMQRYKQATPPLAFAAVEALAMAPTAITHLIVTSCTGFTAPGLDLALLARFGLRETTERSMIGFMGCYAAFNALKLARHIVRSEAQAQVLIVNLELCTLHLQETDDLEAILSFMLFADGAAASLVSAAPSGLRLDGFHSALLPDSAEQITWDIGDTGFAMHLSGEVPRSVLQHLPHVLPALLPEPAAIHHWAIHPGGRSVLDSVAESIGLTADALFPSREVLRRYGNMSSATIMFVLQAIMSGAETVPGGAPGCALGFGPGITAEAMRFTKV